MLQQFVVTKYGVIIIIIIIVVVVAITLGQIVKQTQIFQNPSSGQNTGEQKKLFATCTVHRRPRSKLPTVLKTTGRLAEGASGDHQQVA
jgi:hypothetical protein